MLRPDWRPKESSDERLDLLKQIGLLPKSVPGLAKSSRSLAEEAPLPLTKSAVQRLPRPASFERANGALLQCGPTSMPATSVAAAPIMSAAAAAAADMVTEAPVTLGPRVQRTVLKAIVRLLGKIKSKEEMNQTLDLLVLQMPLASLNQTVRAMPATWRRPAALAGHSSRTVERQSIAPWPSPC